MGTGEAVNRQNLFTEQQQPAWMHIIPWVNLRGYTHFFGAGLDSRKGWLKNSSAEGINVSGDERGNVTRCWCRGQGGLGVGQGLRLTEAHAILVVPLQETEEQMPQVARGLPWDAEKKHFVLRSSLLTMLILRGKPTERRIQWFGLLWSLLPFKKGWSLYLKS